MSYMALTTRLIQEYTPVSNNLIVRSGLNLLWVLEALQRKETILVGHWIRVILMVMMK